MHFHIKLQPTFFGTAMLMLALLFSCGNNGSIEADSNQRKSLFFQKSKLSYQFSSSSSIFGLGDPFDFAYYYESHTNKEYVYQIRVESEEKVSVLKFELKELVKEPIALDTFYLEGFTVAPKTQSLWMFVDEGGEINIIKKNIVKHGVKHLDSTFSYREDKLITKNAIDLENAKENQVASYSIRFHHILSNKYLESIVPIYEYHVPFEKKLEVPSLLDLKKNVEMWQLRGQFNSLSKEQYSLVETPLIIYQSDRICHLNPGLAEIDVFYPESGEYVSVKIPLVEFDHPIADNPSTYSKVLERECDYWFDFMYNPYTHEYYLFQHIGQPYFDESGNTIELDSTSNWGRILLLDDEYQYLGDTIINTGNKIETIIHPKFPTHDGYWTIEIESVNNDSDQTTFNVRLQKMILHAK